MQNARFDSYNKVFWLALPVILTVITELRGHCGYDCMVIGFVLYRTLCDKNI
jgi:hypothetical protein